MITSRCFATATHLIQRLQRLFLSMTDGVSVGAWTERNEIISLIIALLYRSRFFIAQTGCGVEADARAGVANKLKCHCMSLY